MRDSSAVARGWQRVGRGHAAHPALFALALASALSCWVYWPLLSNLRSITSTDPDTPLFVWALAHSPHRLLHGSNPFFSSVIFATTGGANLAFNTTVPLLGLLMAPVTLTAGPVAAFNVIMLMTPALNTVAARRLLVVVTARSTVSVTAGAFVIGFSPLILMHNPARFQVSFQCLVLLALAELWLAGQSFAAGQPLSLRRFAVIGALCGAQLWVGSELLAIVLLVSCVTLVVASFIRGNTGGATPPPRGLRRPQRADVAALAVGAGVMVLVAAPFLSAFFFGSERYRGGYHVAARPLFGIRIANLFTATESTLIRSPLPFSVDRSALSPFYAEDTGYVGVFGIVLVVLVVLTWRNRVRIQRVSLVVGLLCWALALGPTIRWSGMNTGIPGPWRLIEYLPALQEIVANRLSWGMFAAFGIAIASGTSSDPAGQSRWSSAGERSFRWMCVGLVVLLFPARFDQTRSVSLEAVTVVRQQCRNALVLTVLQDLEQDAMELQARATFDFDLYRGFAFRASSGAKGDRLLIDEIAERGVTSDAQGTAAVVELKGLGIGCVIAPTASVGTIDNVTSLLGPPIIGGEVAVWPQP